MSQKIIGSYPDVPKNSCNILRKLPHSVECTRFMPSSLTGKFSMSRISADFWVVHLKICRNACSMRISFSDDCVKELLFCLRAWSVILVNLSNNFTRITLYHMMASIFKNISVKLLEGQRDVLHVMLSLTVTEYSQSFT